MQVWQRPVLQEYWGGDVAAVGQFEQGAMSGGPAHGQTAAHEGDLRPGSWAPGRLVRCCVPHVGHSWVDGGQCAEHSVCRRSAVIERKPTALDAQVAD